MKTTHPTGISPADSLEHTRLRLSFRATGAGLWDYDVDDDLLYCDDRWYEIIGVDRSATPIITIGDFRPFIHPSDTAALNINRQRLQQLLDRDEGYRQDFRIVRPDGEMRWIRSVACIIRDDQSHHLRAIGCVTDISEFRGGVVDAPRPGAVTTQRLAKPRKPAPPDPSARGDLTSKEKQCLAWVSVGKTAWETAVILGLSRRTVEFHLLNATRKLDAANKVQAAFIAVSRNLLGDLPETLDR